MSEIPRSIQGHRATYRKMGLCQECGGVLDLPGRFVRCKACRDIYTEYSRAYSRLKAEGDTPLTPNQAYIRAKMKKEAEALIRADRYREQIRKCTGCEWARIEEGVVYCPFMEGICMKGARFYGKTDAD